MTTLVRAFGTFSILAAVTLMAGCSPSGDDEATEASAEVTVEVRPVHLAGATANARGMLPDGSEDWSLYLADLGLPASDDAVAAAEWVAAENCMAEPVTTPEVAGACSTDGSEIFLLDAVALDESNLVSVEQMDDQDPNATVLLTLDDSGAAALKDLTGEVASLQNPRNRVAIVVDGKVLSAPAMTQEISGGKVQMVGDPDDPSIQALVDAFNG